ncbi:TDP-N-acetylfucosamine:lipid II N-acetylfucosaminyltransferase [Geofilum rubicundum]|uniref:TDP-N-acetylfucosamine:lipid II N-acetylfucosaminyltransferase n=1 Tax=Geofilum rubicundum TaxID=472113 RepID=UPI00138E3F01|nr:TDP-N-acetylfucosamine:lipid II N-acetylfucosaminyltransferase [Geofilum rubicundum]
MKDEKIIDQIIENFLLVSQHNVFLVFSNDDTGNFKHISFNDEAIIKAYNIKRDDINEVLIMNEAQAIVLHSLDYLFTKVIDKINIDIRIAWIAWGFEIYMHPKNRRNLYAKKTKQFLIQKRPLVLLKWHLTKWNYLRFVTNNVLNLTNSYIDLQEKSFKRIHFLATYIYEDYVFFKNLFPHTNLSYHEVAFSTIHQYLAGTKDLKIDGKARNILVGNSNSLESNYLDAIDVLYGVKETGTIYFVLSYGNDPGHSRAVLKKGKKKLKGRFHPLLNFLDRAEYIKILQSCSVGIFYHFRQQAMGNIIAMLYMGARVYLSTKNPAYLYFKRSGIAIFNIENDFEIYGNRTLEVHEQILNREKLEQMFSREKVIGDLYSLTMALLN